MTPMKKLNLVGLAGLLMAAAPALANDMPAGDTASNSKFMAKAFAIAVAVVGGAIGQGMAASSAVSGISRNPDSIKAMFTPFVLGLALIESLVLLAFVIAFLM